MNEDLGETIKSLTKMNRATLHAYYEELIGSAPPCSDRRYVLARIGWTLQSSAGGALSERARERATGLAAGFDLRLRPVRPEGVAKTTGREASRDVRLPAPGTVLTRYYKSEPISVQVLERGFEHQGQRYNSLSAVVLRATGTRWNGFLFFGLNGGERHAGSR